MSSVLDEIRALVVIAPHPDDESLGCGGLIALARQRGLPVTLIFVSDGTGSHPRSRDYPAPRLKDLRAEEALQAAKVLGVSTGSVAFLGLRDTAVPHRHGSVEFLATVSRITALLTAAQADAVAVTHRDEPHHDHSACFHLARQAIARLPGPIRLLEYRIWLKAPGAASVKRLIHSIDVTGVLEGKRRAIACHRSQTTNLIDDPTGFRLSPADVERLSGPFECFEEELCFEEEQR